MGVHSALRIAAALTLLVGLAAGCDVGVYGESAGGADGGTAADAGGDEPLTFAGAIGTDIDMSCSLCHGETPVDNDLTLDFAGAQTVIDTGTPANSSLLLEVDPSNDNLLTPLHAATQDQDRHDLYLEWIEAGAPEN